MGTSNDYSVKPKYNQNFGKTNKPGPKKIWVPKDKIIYVADIFSSKAKTPVMVPDSGCSQHMTGRKHMFQSLELKLGGYVDFGGNQRWKIIASGTVGNGNLPSINKVLLVDRLMNNLLSISKLSDNSYDIIFNQNS